MTEQSTATVLRSNPTEDYLDRFKFIQSDAGLEAFRQAIIAFGNNASSIQFGTAGWKLEKELEPILAEARASVPGRSERLDVNYKGEPDYLVDLKNELINTAKGKPEHDSLVPGLIELARSYVDTD